MHDHYLSALLVAVVTALTALIHKTFTSFLQSSLVHNFENLNKNLSFLVDQHCFNSHNVSMPSDDNADAINATLLTGFFRVTIDGGSFNKIVMFVIQI